MIDRRTFLSGTIAAVAAASLKSPSAFAETRKSPANSILQARGLEIVAGLHPVRLRGVNLGGWMLIEDYMIGLPWTEWKIRERFRAVLGDKAYSAFFRAFAQTYIAKPDIDFIAKQGFNFVRLPFNYRHFESDLRPGEWIEDGFRQLDRVVGYCRARSLYVLLDLHAAPGAQARDQNAGSAYGETYLWNHKNFMDRTIALWQELARRYRGDATIAGYNLLCEPVTGDVDLLNSFYLKAIRAIRTVDPKHLIVLDSNRWGKDVSSLHSELFEDPQVIPVLHHYYSDDASFSRLTAYPGSFEGKLCDRTALAATLNGKHDQQRIPRPTMVSEFGVWRESPQAYDVQLAITKDLVSIFEEKGWGWAMWCYKDLRSMGLLTPKADTPWRKFLDSEEIVNFFKQYRALETPFVESVGKILSSTDIDVDVREQWAREVGRDFDSPALDFVLRKLSKHSVKELEAMGASFAFESCEIHQDQLAVLTPFLTR